MNPFSVNNNVAEDDAVKRVSSMTEEEKISQIIWENFKRYMFEKFPEYAFDESNCDKWMLLYVDAVQTAVDCTGTTSYRNFFEKQHIKHLLEETEPWLNEFLSFVVEELVREYSASRENTISAEDAIQQLTDLHKFILNETSDPLKSSFTSFFNMDRFIEATLENRVWKWFRILFPYIRYMMSEKSGCPLLKPPSREDQIEQVRAFLDMECKDQEMRCAVPKKWLEQYNEFLSAKVGRTFDKNERRWIDVPAAEQFDIPIDVLNHYKYDSASKQMVAINDYNLVFIRTEAYNLLTQWFGGGPRMEHKMILSAKGAVVPILKKYTVKVDFLGTLPGTAEILTFPDISAKELILAAVAAGFSSEDDQNTWKQLLQSEVGVELTKKSYMSEEDPFELDHVLIDTIDRDNMQFIIRKGLAPGETKYTPGQCGLQNIGNTCYMNSALQCLSHCEQFRKGLFALSDGDVSPSSHPVTHALKSLLKKMWSGKHNVVVPRELRDAVGQKYRRFQTYEQQDAIEYVLALLDEVHDELNPVKTKKYRERVDADAEIPEAELSKIYWDDYKNNNQSLVAECFHGQMKSRLECLTCGRTSVVFDGISCIPVALDRLDMYSLDVLMFFTPTTKTPGHQLWVRIRVPAHSPTSMVYAELRQWLEENGHEAALLFLVKNDVLKQEDLFAPPIAVVNKTDRFIAYVMEEHKVVHDQRVRLEKQKEERLKAKEQQEKQKRLEKKEREAEEARQKEQKEGENAKGLEVSSAAAQRSNSDAHVDPEASSSAAEEGKEEKEEPQADPLWGRVLICLNASSDTSISRYAGFKIPLFVPDIITNADLHTAITKTVSRYLTPLKPEVVTEVEDAAKDVEKVSEETMDLKIVEKYGWRDYDLNQDDKSFWPKPPTDFHQYASGVFSVTFDGSKFKIISVECKQGNSMKTVPGNKKKKTAISLEKCLSVKTQLLSGEDQWYCPKCETHRDAKKDERIFRMPQVCIIQYKRFQMCLASLTTRKLDTEVNFPTKLDFEPYVENDHGTHETTKYQLSGVLDHSGSLSFGHYTANAFNSGQWVNFNDAHTSPLNSDAPPHHLAYLLFFTALPQETPISPRKFDEEDEDIQQDVQEPLINPLTPVSEQQQHFPSVLPATANIDELD